jgi:hypothetical protein
MKKNRKCTIIGILFVLLFVSTIDISIARENHFDKQSNSAFSKSKFEDPFDKTSRNSDEGGSLRNGPETPGENNNDNNQTGALSDGQWLLLGLGFAYGAYLLFRKKEKTKLI